MKKYQGNSKLLLQPRNTQQISSILKYCNERKLPIVPQGGNTGLVGGSVPVSDEIIVSLSRMNKILSFDKFSAVLTCEAGCILETVDNHLRSRYSHMMPLDLGAKGSCQIGGNLATNAGGLRLLRYGSLRGNVLGLEAVLPDGSVFSNMNTLKKDNTGYDLKQLLIGSEGTLGIITGAAIQTFPAPAATNVAILGTDSYEKILEIYYIARQKMQEIISAFEFWDNQAMNVLERHLPTVHNPLGDSFPFYLLVETQGSNAEHDKQKFEEFLEAIVSQDLASSGVLAQDTEQINNFWNTREAIPEACSKEGAVYKYDLSIQIDKLYDLVPIMRQKLGSRASSVLGYGHVGDGNIHMNISTARFTEEITDIIEPFVYEYTRKMRYDFIESLGGSISAEHGIGLMKTKYLKYSKTSQLIDMMQSIKKLVDPNGIMNPYKVLPSQNKAE